MSKSKKNKIAVTLKNSSVVDKGKCSELTVDTTDYTPEEITALAKLIQGFGAHGISTSAIFRFKTDPVPAIMKWIKEQDGNG